MQIRTLIEVHLKGASMYQLSNEDLQSYDQFCVKKVEGLSDLQGDPLEGIGWNLASTYIDGVTILGVPLCDLKGIRK